MAQAKSRISSHIRVWIEPGLMALTVIRVSASSSARFQGNRVLIRNNPTARHFYVFASSKSLKHRADQKFGGLDGSKGINFSKLLGGAPSHSSLLSIPFILTMARHL